MVECPIQLKRRLKIAFVFWGGFFCEEGKTLDAKIELRRLLLLPKTNPGGGVSEIKKARKEPAEAVLGEGSPETGWQISGGRTREALLRQIINTQLFHGDDPPAEPLPDMTESPFSDDDMNSVLLRHTASELVIDEFEFACC